MHQLQGENPDSQCGPPSADVPSPPIYKCHPRSGVSQLFIPLKYKAVYGMSGRLHFDHAYITARRAIGPHQVRGAGIGLRVGRPALRFFLEEFRTPPPGMSPARGAWFLSARGPRHAWPEW
jgi:hypothetical protein